MNSRNSGTLHYINAIKGCSVFKIQNVNSRGLVFKDLKDIYEVECARHLDVPVKKELQDSCEDEVLSHKNNFSCLPMAERATSEREHEASISHCSSNVDEIASGLDDVSFGEITLKQLKKRCKTKKRKKSEFVCLSPKKELTEFLQDGDDCDLTTPLSSWNVKLPKSAKSKKKRAKSSANCAPMAIKVEGSPASPICCSDFQTASFVTEAGYGSSSSDEQVNLSDMDFLKLRQTSDTTLENEEINSLAGQYETHVLYNNSFCQLDDDFMPVSSVPLLSGNTEGPSTQEMGQHPNVFYVSELQKEAEMMHLPSSQSLLLIDKPVYDNRLVISSQISYDMQEISCQGTGDQVSDVPLKNDICCTETVHGRELCILEDNASTSSNMFNSSPCCFSMPVIFNKESGRLISNTDYSIWCTKSGGINLSVFEVIKSIMQHNLPNNFLRSPFCYYSSPWNCHPCSASDSDLVAPENNLPMIDDNRSLISDSSYTARNSLEPNINRTCLEDSSYANKEKQSLLLVNADAEIGFSSNAVDQLSNLGTNNHYDMVLWHPPTRKVISPSSQEKLCLAMSSRETYDDTDNYKCKGKLFFGNQIEDSTPSASSETADGESYMTDESNGQVTLTKAILGPKKILKKQKRNKKGSPPKKCSSPKGHVEGLTKKGSPPKGRLEGPHTTCSLHGLCTARTSNEACRESVIEFSQRQMHDIESIAVKLMTELKSMKDIVEHKFLDEVYHCTSMKNDADEVKSAIKNATRVGETTKKWLSMMARDCNRFCKIMSQPQRSTEDVATATENVMHKKKKKISFADEAGGVLCHVKYI